MILEIALGIVLAVLILRFLAPLLAGALLLACGAALLALLVLLWAFRDKALIVVLVLAAIASMTVLPMWLKDLATKRWPALDALIKGEPPYVGLAAQPKRIAIMAMFAASLGGIGIGSLLVMLYVVDVVEKLVGSPL